VRVSQEPEQPFKPGPLHEDRRTPLCASQEGQAGPDAQAGAAATPVPGDRRGQPFLPRRADGQEDEARRVRQHKRNRGGEGGRVAIEPHRRIVMGRLAQPIARHQTRHMIRRQADDRDRLVWRQGLQQPSGQIRTGGHARRVHGQQAGETRHHSGIQQP